LSATSADQRKQERLARLILSAPVSGVVPRAEQQGRQLAAAADAELGVRPVQVVVDGAHRYHEALGECRGWTGRGGQPGDLPLAGGEVGRVQRRECGRAYALAGGANRAARAAAARALAARLACRCAADAFFYCRTPMYRPEPAMDGWE
jgi:hypothetical protein